MCCEFEHQARIHFKSDSDFTCRIFSSCIDKTRRRKIMVGIHEFYVSTKERVLCDPRKLIPTNINATTVNTFKCSLN